MQSPVFEKTYRDYLDQVGAVDLKKVASMPDLRLENDFREIPDSAPLGGYFGQNVEGVIETAFAGHAKRLRAAAMALGGRPAAERLPYDLSVVFQALPGVPLLLFNDADAEFAATCSLLFQKNAPQFLDPECLAMTAAYLARTLNQTA